MKRNFHKVFGDANDSMAEMMFRYMSNCREDPRTNEFMSEVKEQFVSDAKKDKNADGAYDSVSDVAKARVNFHTFLKKFEAIWQKKPAIKRYTEASLIEQEEFILRQAKIRE